MNEWQAENERLKLAYFASRGETDAEEIRLKSNCSFADAWRIASIRYIGSSLLIEQWLSGRLTWARLWRVASRYPCDSEAQVRNVKAHAR